MALRHSSGQTLSSSNAVDGPGVPGLAVAAGVMAAVDAVGTDVEAGGSLRAGGVDAHATASAARVASEKSREEAAILTGMKTYTPTQM